MKNFFLATACLYWTTGLFAQGALFQPGYTNIVSVAVSPDGKTMAVEGETAEVSLWDLTARKKTMTLKRLPKPVKTDADDEMPDMGATFGFAVPEYSTTIFSASGETFIIGNSAGVTAWNVKNATPTVQLWVGPDQYDISSDGRYIVAAKSGFDPDGEDYAPARSSHQSEPTYVDTLLLYTTADGKSTQIKFPSTKKAQRIRFVPGTNTVLIADANGDLRMVDLTTGKSGEPVRVYKIDDDDIIDIPMSMFVSRSIAVHPKKPLVALAGGNHLYFFDFKENRLKANIQLPEPLIPGMAFHDLQFTPDGKYLFGVRLTTTGEGITKTLAFWNAESGAQMKEMTIESLWSAYAFSPDGQWFALCKTQAPKYSTGQISIFNAATFEEVESFGGKGALGFFPNDARRLAYRADTGIGAYQIKH